MAICTTIFSCYNSANASDQISPPSIMSYLSLSSIFPNTTSDHCGITNAQISKNENNKFYLHNSLNRNGEYLAYFSQEQACIPKH